MRKEKPSVVERKVFLFVSRPKLEPGLKLLSEETIGAGVRNDPVHAPARRSYFFLVVFLAGFFADFLAAAFLAMALYLLSCPQNVRSVKIGVNGFFQLLILFSRFMFRMPRMVARGVDEAADKLRAMRESETRRSLVIPPHPGPLPRGEGGRRVFELLWVVNLACEDRGFIIRPQQWPANREPRWQIMRRWR